MAVKSIGVILVVLIFAESITSHVISSGNSSPPAMSKKQTWFDFRTTFSAAVVFGFHKQPRTEKAAIKKGFQKIGYCGDGSMFVGERYIPSYDDISMVLIYGANGYICGMQSIIRKSEIGNAFNDMDTNPMYQSGTIKGEDVFFSTAYFVDPKIICAVGRPTHDYQHQGTGYTLKFQNGRSADEANLITAPLTETQAQLDPLWFKHLCFLNMGTHYFPFNDEGTNECQKTIPIQLLYHNGVLNGFVWSHYGTYSGNRWEHPPALVVSSIISNPSPCIYEAIETVGLSTMHVYFREHLLLC